VDYAKWIITVAAAVGAITYLAHTLNKLVRKADEILALPTAYRHLALAVEQLDHDIAELALQVARLAAAERARGT
jgi:outer membrane murein-binding lipoprotein Lpp